MDIITGFLWVLLCVYLYYRFKSPERASVYMQPSIFTKLGVNVTSKLVSVLKHNATSTVENRGKIQGSVVFRIRKKFSFMSGPFYPSAAIRAY
jgi:hypothetical protein